MPRYEITAPDGTRWEVNAPDNATEAEVLEYARKQWSAQPATTPMPSAPQEPRTQNNNLGAQIGLTARAGVNALAALPGLVTDAVGGVANFAQDRLLGEGRGVRFQTLGSLANRAMDAVGLPKPDTPTQRVASQGVEMMAGAGGMAGAARAVAGVADDFAMPVLQDVMKRLSDDPLMQIIAGGSSGVAGQQAKESGATGVGQFVSAVGGGLAGAGAVGGTRSMVEGVRKMLPGQQRLIEQKLERTINISLQNNGIDPSTITPAMRTMLREQVKKAMNLGDVDENAIARLADYTRLGMTPTRSRLTLDPYDVTQEQNAAKLAAATGARDARLPTIANENNRTLLSTVDEFGPMSDRFLTGQTAMSPIRTVDRMLEAGKNSLYKQAEDMAGGDIPLNRKPFMDAIYERLNTKNLVRFVPPSVQSMLDDMSSGVIKRGDQTFEVPFNVKAIDSLKSLIATEQRSAQGSAKQALAEIRNALDSIPLEPVKRQFGGNQLVTEQGAKFLRDQDALAGQLKQVLDQARQANWRWNQWRDSAPGIRAAVDDENPQVFVQNYIRSNAADFRDVAKTAAVINKSPEAKQAVRAELVQYLKDAAIGQGKPSDLGNFSGPGWLKALDAIGERKLGLFFDKDEIETLKALGRVGGYETFQPRGSAVNNSNTAAGVAGLVQGISKMLKPAANKLPFGEIAISSPLDNMAITLMERRANDLAGGLLTPRVAPNGSIVDPLLMPAVIAPGLLSQ